MSFWAIFVLWPSKQPKKWKFQKNEKKPGDIIILLKCTKIMMIGYTIPEIWRVTDVIVIFHYGLFLPFYSFNSPKTKISKKKKKKMPGDSSFYTSAPKTVIRWCTIPEIWCVTDGRTDGRTEKVTYRGGCPAWKWI